MVVPAYKVCTCKGVWGHTLLEFRECMHLLAIHISAESALGWVLQLAGLGVAIGLYNMLGIRMYVGQTKQFLEVGTKKIKTQHNLVTSKSDVHGSQATKVLHQTKILNRDMGIQIEWKCSQCTMSRETSLDVWDINSDRMDQCMYDTSY